MEIRPATPADFDALLEIDGTAESTHYLHVDQAGEALSVSWRLEERPLRERKVASNPIPDERRFLLKQILLGADEGIVWIAMHDSVPAAMLLAQLDEAAATLRIIDLRVEFDYRRQGIATGMLFMLIAEARERALRAVVAESRTDNAPAYHLLSRCGFDISGIDTRRHSNHDLVKESATILWYATLD